MRAKQKICATIAVVTAILVVPPLLLWAWDATASVRGAFAATRDLSHGRIAILAYGLPPGGRDQYARLLKQRYRIEYRQVALCIVSPALVAYADSYRIPFPPISENRSWSASATPLVPTLTWSFGGG